MADISHDSTHAAVYKGLDDRTTEEYVRLKRQHQLSKRGMGNKLVLAPIDLNQPVRILDVGTGDGLWMSDLAADHPEATLVGTDIKSDHFTNIPNLTPRASFEIQSMLEDYPSSWAASFDLAHVRYMLSMCSPDLAGQAVARLFGVVKPGGFIQLCEVDLRGWDMGVGHEAFAEYSAVTDKAFTGGNMNPSPVGQLTQWLKDAGCVDVEERYCEEKLGKAAPTEALNEETTAQIGSMVDNFAHIASLIPDYFYTPEQFSKLRQAVIRELEEKGNTWRYRVAWGRKPNA